jgi:HSP20 family protein
MTLLRSIVPSIARPARASAKDAEPKARPVFQVREDDHGYDVTVFLPGVAKENLEITEHEGELIISGRRTWQPPKEWAAVYRETPRAHFELRLSHEGDLDLDKINAELKDGRLHLLLPRGEAAKPRKIAIS